jgi:uncharacterized membrane protein YvlD (DUF360 family)
MSRRVSGTVIIRSRVADDPILARQLQAMAFFLVGMALVGLALYLRLRVFVGRQPGGVDTWYYLASADALRSQKRVPIALPQYLLHDKKESYPVVFPLFLALLPRQWLRNNHWLVSPLIDACHLLLLYLLAFRLTDSVLAAGIAGLIYAVTPQLVSETRNLNGRAFASLLLTLAMLVLMRSVIPSAGPTNALGNSERVLTVVAALLIALLYNTHTSTTIAFVVSALVLSVVTDQPRFIVLALLGLPLAIVLSGGYYLRVINNHISAARFWMRNVQLTRAHQVDDSPIFGAATGSNQTRGLYAPTWRSRLGLVVRLLGENPFILAMLATPIPDNVWAFHMYWWAVAILGWSVLTTFGGPLRILGPGFHYMKASIFPTAYTLAVTVNMREGGFSAFDVMLLISFMGSFAALSYFYRVMDARKTELTAQTPPDLAKATEYLRDLPEGNVLVLPNMYADFVTYNSSKPVLWGGHSGDLSRFEEFFPVIRRPLTYFFARYHIKYALLDLLYTTPTHLNIDTNIDLLEKFGSINIFQVRSLTALESTEQSAPSLSRNC